MADLEETVECYVHTGRRAVGACVACGQLICEECRVTLEGRIHCKACVERGAGPPPPRRQPAGGGPGGELRRSRNDKVLGGVCAGLAREFNMETTLCRVLAVLIVFFTGILPGVVVYCVLWAVLKEE
jgi:phage shock protein PspC (stress-responsive transcriptional regulator)